MGTILHIYRIEGRTTNEFVEKNFTQRFIHVHSSDDSHTILLRAMDFSGKKLDTITDEDEIIKIMEDIEGDISDQERRAMGKFISGEETDGILDNGEVKFREDSLCEKIKKTVRRIWR